MSAQIERPPDEVSSTESGGLDNFQSDEQNQTLASLPLGARLILRCRHDWRSAAIASVSNEAVTLTVFSPTGRTYRVRRSPDSLVTFEGAIPILGEGQWRTGFARYDARW